MITFTNIGKTEYTARVINQAGNKVGTYKHRFNIKYQISGELKDIESRIGINKMQNLKVLDNNSSNERDATEA